MKPEQVRQSAKIFISGAKWSTGKVAGKVTGDSPAVGPHQSVLNQALGHRTSHIPTRTPTPWGVGTEECLPLI